MRKILLFSVLCLLCVNSASAQDARLAGVWKRHINIQKASYDQFIRIDIDGERIYVSMKRNGTNVDGEPFQDYFDCEDVEINSEGSISFNRYYGAKNECDEEDRLYWTCFENYSVRFAAGRLRATEQYLGYGRNSSGEIVKRAVHSPDTFTYFNINDNW